jgi:transketolase
MRDLGLQVKAAMVRKNILGMMEPPKFGHLGGSMSCVEILIALYFGVMRLGIDKFVLSKGHASLALYSVLAEVGYISHDELARVKTLGSILQGHPDMNKTPGVDCSTGSLGQGLSMGLGMALGLVGSADAPRVFVLLGDGECAEGQVWEAAMAARAFGVSNLTAIIDHNGLQATGCIAERMNQGDLGDKWKAFGWEVVRVDGHDLQGLVDALSVTSLNARVIIAETVKGKGIAFAEGVPSAHNCALTLEQYRSAMDQLDLLVERAEVQKS